MDDPVDGSWLLDWHAGGRGLLQYFTTPTGAQWEFGFDRGKLSFDINPDGHEIRFDERIEGNVTAVDMTGPRPNALETFAYEPTRDGDGNRAISARGTAVSGDGTVVRAADSSAADRRVEMPDGTVVTATLAADPRFGMLVPYASHTEVTLPNGELYAMTQHIAITEDGDGNIATLGGYTHRTTLPGDREYTSSWDATTRMLTSTTPEGSRRPRWSMSADAPSSTDLPDSRASATTTILTARSGMFA